MSNEWGTARTLIAHCSLLIALTGCKAPARLPLKSIAAPREPQIRATVVTVQTTLWPQNKMFIHVLAIANGRARSSDEVDSWRLFDLNRDSVTFVDDIAKTYRTESFRSLLAKRREAVIAPLPEGITPAKLSVTGAKRAGGVKAPFAGAIHHVPGICGCIIRLAGLADRVHQME